MTSHTTMRRAILFLTVLVAACGPARPGTTEPLLVRSFVSLATDEVLTYSKTYDGDTWAIVLSATTPRQKALRELLRISNFDRGKVVIVDNGKKAFFVIYNQNPHEISDLWVADGSRGKAYPLFRSASTFAVSLDGRFICYQDLEQDRRDQTGSPTVNLYDTALLKVVKSITYAEEALRDTVANISYDATGKVFRVEFVVEDRTVGSRTVELP